MNLENNFEHSACFLKIFHFFFIDFNFIINNFITKIFIRKFTNTTKRTGNETTLNADKVDKFANDKI